MKQVGMSLVELMVVVLLIGLLALVASPFTSAWVHEADRTKTLALLQQAVGSAKANAMRNTTGVQGQGAVVALCRSDRDLRLVPIASITNCTASSALWTAKVPDGVDIKIDVNDWTCSCFTNRGLLTTVEASCNTCGSSMAFTVSAGGVSETLSIY